MDKKVIEADEIIVPKSSAPKKGSKVNSLKNNKPLMIIASVLLLLVILFLVYSIFTANPYKYSFNISGVNFVSNTYTPSEFFKEFKSNESFVLSMDVVDNASSAWVVNSTNLWITVLNFDKKRVFLVVKNVNQNGEINSCLTNDANVLVSRDLTADECKVILNDSTRAQIAVVLSNKDEVLMEENKLTIFASGTKTISHINYYAIKEMYSNFDEILAIINEKIGSIN